MLSVVIHSIIPFDDGDQTEPCCRIARFVEVICQSGQVQIYANLIIDIFIIIPDTICFVPSR